MSPLKPLLIFLVHVFVGCSVLAVIAVGALGIGQLVTWMEARHCNDAVILILRIAEYALFGCDILLFLIFLVKSTISTIRKL
jgi:hypothetical protein